MSARHRAILLPVLFGLSGVAILLVLGTWQLQRLEWKEGLIAEIEARLGADPVSLPVAPDAEGDRLRRVTVEGRLGTGEIHALSSVKGIGPGFRVIVPLEIAGADGPRRILADLGFVPERLKAPSTREQTAPAGPATVTGLLHWPRETDSMTPDPDLAKNVWFARDVDAMARQLGTEPVLLVAESHPLSPWPRPRPPGVGLPNRHLEYALTWYGLAAVWVVMTLLWVRSIRRRPAA